jgi:nicotinamidase-related amidase
MAPLSLKTIARNGIVFAASLFAIALFATNTSHAQTIVDEWASVKTPAPPELKQVKIDPKTTAYLVLDLFKAFCGEDRPRCFAALPKVGKFLGDARAHNVTVIYSMVPGKTTKDLADQIAPKGDEPTITAEPDKFLGTDLDKILKDHGITTLIISGTSTQGAVLFTAGQAALRGYKVIVPLDGAPSGNPFDELAAARLLAVAPVISPATTLTRFDMIGWQ